MKRMKFGEFDKGNFIIYFTDLCTAWIFFPKTAYSGSIWLKKKKKFKYIAIGKKLKVPYFSIQYYLLKLYWDSIMKKILSLSSSNLQLKKYALAIRQGPHG